MAQIIALALNPAIDISSDADVVRTTRKVRTFNETYDPGGGGVNVARVVTELRGDVELVYLAGGATGALLDELLDRATVRRRHVRIVGDTRISFTVHERESGLEYRFVASGPELSQAELDACLLALGTCDFSYLVASGSLPRGVPGDFLARVATVASAKGARFILDSSGAGLKETLAQTSVFLMKPNLEELQELTGKELNEDTARAEAEELVRRGQAEIVAVTMGASGAILATRRGTLRVPALEVDVRSSVGAGDSFLGAMTLALAQERTSADALCFAMAAGASALLHPGTKLCSRDSVLKLYAAARMTNKAFSSLS
jgi:6-phosphofructokinase 2